MGGRQMHQGDEEYHQVVTVLEHVMSMESPKYCWRSAAHFGQKRSKCSAVCSPVPQRGQIGDVISVIDRLQSPAVSLELFASFAASSRRLRTVQNAPKNTFVRLRLWHLVTFLLLVIMYKLTLLLLLLCPMKAWYEAVDVSLLSLSWLIALCACRGTPGGILELS